MGNLEPLFDAIARRVDKVGMARTFKAAAICEAANRVLPLTARAKIFRNGVMTIATRTGADGYWFKQDLEGWREKINAALPEPLVTSLRVRIQSED